MSKKISIVLLEDVDSLGREGDVVEVAEGYARNSLFPDGKAALATKQVKEQQKKDHDEQIVKEEQRLKKFQKTAEKLEGSELVIEARINEGDELYGSVTAKDISSKLNEDANIATNERDISLESVIKKIGTYDVTVRLSEDVEFALQVAVVPDEESKNKKEENEEE